MYISHKIILKYEILRNINNKKLIKLESHYKNIKKNLKYIINEYIKKLDK